MNAAQLRKIEEWYFSYVDRFRVGGELHAVQQIKHEHSLRVADEAESLARDLLWPETEVMTARALGLLHDIGRFSQFADFGTIVDHKTVDHAQRGLEVLLSENPLAEMNENEKTFIKQGVRWHNGKTIPDGLADDVSKFVKLIRDADKLDGFWIVYDAVVVKKNKNYEALFSNRNHEEKANRSLVDAVRQGKMVSYVDMRTIADYLVLQIGWIYDINYSVSMRRIRDRRVIENFSIFAPSDEGIAQAAQTAAIFRDKWLRAVSC